MTPCRIVLADDVDDVRLMLRLNFELDGRLEVVGEARTGGEAIEVVLATTPELLLLDLAMPEMDGFTALSEVRRLAPATETVILSGFCGPDIEARALELGARDCLQKGLPMSQIIDRLIAVCVEGGRETTVSAP